MEHLHDVHSFECDEIGEDASPEKIKKKEEEEEEEKKREDQKEEEEEQKVGEGGRTSARRFNKEKEQKKEKSYGRVKWNHRNQCYESYPCRYTTVYIAYE